MSGKTVVAEFDSRGRPTVYVGNYHPASNGTAHERLAGAAGVDTSRAIGMSIRPGGEVGYNSESLNRDNLGRCSAQGHPAAAAVEAKLQNNDYYTLTRSGEPRHKSDKY
jgi:hypothetical protein